MRTKNLYFTVDIRTDTGPLKSMNKDAGIILAAHSHSGCMVMAVICDGLECIVNGENASMHVVHRFTEWFEDELMDKALGSPELKDYVYMSFDRLYRECCVYLYEQGLEHRFMGTMPEAFFASSGWYCAYGVGDCRTVLLKKGSTELRYAREDAVISEGHIVRRYLGQDMKCVPRVVCGSFRAGDVAMVCNYGFWGMMPEDYISSLIRKNMILSKKRKLHMDAGTMLDYMIQRLRKEGEGDNISVALICCTVGGEGL